MKAAGFIERNGLFESFPNALTKSMISGESISSGHTGRVGCANCGEAEKSEIQMNRKISMI